MVPFTRFAASLHLAVLKGFFDKNFYLHYANFGRSLLAFPQARLAPGNPFNQSFASAAEAQQFVAACNAFYQEIGFADFLRQR